MDPTEKDPCPFFAKVGACRYGDACSRSHAIQSTDSGCVVLIPNMHQDPLLAVSAASRKSNNGGVGGGRRYSHYYNDDDDQDIRLDEDEDEEEKKRMLELNKNFLEFFEDAMPEFSKAGTIRQFKVCRNAAPHLRGNVYIQYSQHSEALAAVEMFNGRYFAGNLLTCLIVPVPTWRGALCGSGSGVKSSKNTTCHKGDAACNYLHVFENPRGLFRDADFDFEENRGKGGRDRSDIYERGTRADGVERRDRHRDANVRDRSREKYYRDRNRERNGRERIGVDRSRERNSSDMTGDVIDRDIYGRRSRSRSREVRRDNQHYDRGNSRLERARERETDRNSYEDRNRARDRRRSSLSPHPSPISREHSKTIHPESRLYHLEDVTDHRQRRYHDDLVDYRSGFAHVDADDRARSPPSTNPPTERNDVYQPQRRPQPYQQQYRDSKSMYARYDGTNNLVHADSRESMFTEYDGRYIRSQNGAQHPQYEPHYPASVATSSELLSPSLKRHASWSDELRGNGLVNTSDEGSHQWRRGVSYSDLPLLQHSASMSRYSPEKDLRAAICDREGYCVDSVRDGAGSEVLSRTVEDVETRQSMRALKTSEGVASVSSKISSSTSSATGTMAEQISKNHGKGNTTRQNPKSRRSRSASRRRWEQGKRKRMYSVSDSDSTDYSSDYSSGSLSSYDSLGSYSDDSLSSDYSQFSSDSEDSLERRRILSKKKPNREGRTQA